MHTEVGTSLGLSILRGMLEKNGCSVKMVSELGVGTTFWFDLPLEEADSDEMQVHGCRDLDLHGISGDVRAEAIATWATEPSSTSSKAGPIREVVRSGCCSEHRN